MKTLIKNATIFTQNAHRKIIERGDILIEGSKICDLGNGLSTQADHIINADGLWIIPGLINSHVHLGESAYASVMPERYPLTEYIRNTEKLAINFLLEEERSVIAKYSLLQIVRGGTTTVAGGRTQESSESLGVRNVSGYMLMKSKKLGHFIGDFEAKFSRLISNQKSDLLSHAIFIHSLDTIDLSTLMVAARIFVGNDQIRLMVHVSENADIVGRVRGQYAKNEIQMLDELGLLSQRTLLVHGNQLTEEDLLGISSTKSSVAHCLSSNMSTADKTLNLSSVMKHKINVTVATDGVVTGSDFSVLREAGNAYRYHNRFQKETQIPASIFFDMITINAAEALGLQDKIGSIEIGKDADLAFVTPPVSNTIFGSTKHLIHYANLVQIRDVMIAGKFIIRDSQFICTDIAAEIEQKFSILTGGIRKLNIS